MVAYVEKRSAAKRENGEKMVVIMQNILKNLDLQTNAWQSIAPKIRIEIIFQKPLISSPVVFIFKLSEGKPGKATSRTPGALFDWPVGGKVRFWRTRP
jgi:hypothetical protein